MEWILITNWRSPGDIVCITACVRDLALSYPGRFEIHVAGSCPDLWDLNPYIAKEWGTRSPSGMRRLLLTSRRAMAERDSIRRHYITPFHRDLEYDCGLSVPVLYPKGDLHLSDKEQRESLIEGRYRIVIANGKTDIPVKLWSATLFQEVVDALREQGMQSVQAGANVEDHWHPPLQRVTSLVGKQNQLEFLRLIYHAEGVICPTTFAMHVAAAIDKPCVVIAGGRKPWWWEAYTHSPDQQFGPLCQPRETPHRYLHTIGQLDCCTTTGCWKPHVANETEDGREDWTNGVASRLTSTTHIKAFCGGACSQLTSRLWLMPR